MRGQGTNAIESRELRVYPVYQSGDGTRQGAPVTTTLRVSLLTLSILVLSGCGSGGDRQIVAPNAAFSNASSWSHKKKCASCAYTVEGLNSYRLFLIDATASPPDTVLAVDDYGAIVSLARLNDVLYFTNQYGDLFGFDLSDPQHPVGRDLGAVISSMRRNVGFERVRISGAFLVADFYLGGSDYREGSGTVTWDIKHDPFSPELISFALDPPATTKALRAES